MSSAEAPSSAPAPAPGRGAHRRGERELLDDLRRGDPAAAEALIELTYPMIYKSLYRLCGDGDAAADLTQETYARAWRALAQFDGRSRFSTWLYRIAYTTFLNHVRRPQRFIPLDENLAALATVAEPDAPSRADALRLRREVMALPEDLRFAVTAHFWGDVPVKEIARQEGLTSVAIRKRLRRAIARLRAGIGEETS